MKKIASIVLTLGILLSAVIFCNVKKEANAEEPLPLSVYQNELDKINAQLGTNYGFPTEELLKIEGKTIDDVETYFQQMTLDEFRDYIYNIYQNGYYNPESDYSESDDGTAKYTFPVNTDDSQDANVGNRAYSSTQKYYYSGNTGKYLYITSTVFYADGHDRYSSIDDSSYFHASSSGYPYYVVNNFNSSISTDKRTVSCLFSCYQYVAPYTIDTGIHNINVVFTANGGDVYPVA